MAQFRRVRSGIEPGRATLLRILRCPPTRTRPPPRSDPRVAAHRRRESVPRPGHRGSASLLAARRRHRPEGHARGREARAQDRARLPFEADAPRALRHSHEGRSAGRRKARRSRPPDHARVGPLPQGLDATRSAAPRMCCCSPPIRRWSIPARCSHATSPRTARAARSTPCASRCSERSPRSLRSTIP